MRHLFIALALLVGLGGNVFAQEEDAPIRYVQGTGQYDGELQIAVEQWETATGVKVTLYGVVHIADQEYYQRVQQDLATYDAVLYEGVGATKEALAEAKKNGAKSPLSAIQKGFGTVLGLQFQMDGIAYTHSNMVHADMGREQLKQATGGKPVSPLEGIVSEDMLKKLEPLIKIGGTLLEQYMQANPDLRNQWKTQFASQLATADMTQQLPPDMYKAIVIDRNQVVMDVLSEQFRNHPSRKNLAIFYGAAHNIDFAQRFTQLGWRRTNRRWMTAWKIGAGVPTPSERRVPQRAR